MNNYYYYPPGIRYKCCVFLSYSFCGNIEIHIKQKLNRMKTFKPESILVWCL